MCLSVCVYMYGMYFYNILLSLPPPPPPPPPPSLSPTKVMKESDTVSSEEFMQFLMNLPDSTHLVADPSKGLTTTKYSEPGRGEEEEEEEGKGREGNGRE